MNRLEIVVRLIEAEIAGRHISVVTVTDAHIQEVIRKADKILKLELSTTYPS